jgi:hypothetical protein
LFVDGQKKKRNRWPSFHPASELTEFDSSSLGADRGTFSLFEIIKEKKNSLRFVCFNFLLFSRELVLSISIAGSRQTKR